MADSKNAANPRMKKALLKIIILGDSGYHHLPPPSPFHISPQLADHPLLLLVVLVVVSDDDDDDDDLIAVPGCGGLEESGRRR